MKPKIKIILASLILMFIVVNFAQAAIVNCGGYDEAGQTQRECQISDLVITVIRLINYLYGLAGFIAMGYIVWAGWGMLGSEGNEEKIAGARTTLSHAVIGFFLIAMSYVLINAIVALLGGFSLKQLYNFLMK